MNTSKSYKIRQSSSRNSANKDYFNWEIWIEEGEMPLTSVEKVEYLLHPTFPDRFRTSTDLNQKFKIKSSGWGEFMIKVIIYDKSGSSHTLNHWLVLRDNYTSGGEISSDQNPTKTVFLSYANADTKFAKQLESTLNNLGVKIKSHSNIEPGVSIREHINDSISSSDAMIAIIPDDEDPWQKEEMEIAKNAVVNTIQIEGHKKGSSLNLGSASMSLDDMVNEENIKSIVNKIREL